MNCRLDFSRPRDLIVSACRHARWHFAVVSFVTALTLGAVAQAQAPTDPTPPPADPTPPPVVVDSPPPPTDPPTDPDPVIPTAEVSAVPASPLTNEPVTFAVTGEDPDGGALEYEWDLDGDGFDDGTGPSLGPVSFATPEARTVQVRVTDDDLDQVVESFTLTVRNRPPTADFGWTPSTVERGRPVVFTSRASDPEQGALEQTWDLDGDGAYDDAFGPSVTHSFSARGTHEVGLQVRDAHGGVTVTRLPVVARSVPVRRAGRLLRPFPAVRVAGRLTRSGAVFRLVSIRAPRGSRVIWSCSSRRCRGGSLRAASSRAVRIRPLERAFPAGTVLEFGVTQPGFIGKYTRIQVRRNRAPGRRDMCLRRASDRPIACPSYR